MKRVIRRGVFETNSSSSHSLTLRKVGSENKPVVDDDASFEIRSPLAKLIQIYGLIDNAERHYKSFAENVEEYTDIEMITLAASKLAEEFPEAFKDKEIDKITVRDFAEIVTSITTPENYYCIYDIVSDFNDIIFTTYCMIDNGEREKVLRFKQALFKAFCEITGFTRKQAIEEIEFEAFANLDIRDILKDKTTAKEKLTNLLEHHYEFARHFEKSGDEDIVAFAEKFLYEDCARFKEMVNGRFSCERYFGNGCLDECTCGFESYHDIANNFELDKFDTEERMQQWAKLVLSDRYKFVAVEKYCGYIFEKPGDIY